MLLQPAKIQPDVSGREIASCRTTAAGRPDLPYFSKSLSFVTCDDTSACNQIPPSPSLMTPRPGQGISVPVAEKPLSQLWAGMPISGGPAKESVSRKVILEGMMHTTVTSEPCCQIDIKSLSSVACHYIGIECTKFRTDDYVSCVLVRRCGARG